MSYVRKQLQTHNFSNQCVYLPYSPDAGFCITPVIQNVFLGTDVLWQQQSLCSIDPTFKLKTLVKLAKTTK
jgi:hypothetical protein